MSHQLHNSKTLLELICNEISKIFTVSITKIMRRSQKKRKMKKKRKTRNKNSPPLHSSLRTFSAALIKASYLTG